MAYEEKKQIIEAAKVLKKNCDKIFSTGTCVGCDFFNENKRDCDLYKFPTFWEIPTLTRWSPEDVALAKELKKQGVTHVNRGTDYAFWYDKKNGAFGLLPGKPFWGLNPNDDITPIDTIIKEAEG